MFPMNLTRKALLWTAGAAALAVLAALALRQPTQLASTARVSRGPLTLTLTEEGRTRLKQRYAITAPLAGQVQRVTLRPGDTVRAGQVLADIEPAASALLDARARSVARADITGAEAALSATRQRSAAAATAEAVARQDLARQQALQKQGMVSHAAAEAAQAQAEAASAARATALADEAAAAQRLVAARAALADEGRAGAGRVLSVRAPVDGVVLRRPVESAQPVAAGTLLMDIGDPAALELEVEVLSTDAVRLVAGLPARVLRWGGEGELDATVTRVEPAGFTKVSALGVEEQRTRVILDLSSPRSRWTALGDAYRVEVTFILRAEKDVLQLPGSALFRSGDGWAVYRLDGGRARKVAVKTGLRTATAAQLLEGLAEGDTVILQPDDRIRDGTRIEAPAAP
jgi:HlyD family secretion protein